MCTEINLSLPVLVKIRNIYRDVSFITVGHVIFIKMALRVIHCKIVSSISSSLYSENIDYTFAFITPACLQIQIILQFIKLYGPRCCPIKIIKL